MEEDVKRRKRERGESGREEKNEEMKRRANGERGHKEGGSENAREVKESEEEWLNEWCEI